MQHKELPHGKHRTAEAKSVVVIGNPEGQFSLTLDKTQKGQNTGISSVDTIQRISVSGIPMRR